MCVTGYLSQSTQSRLSSIARASFDSTISINLFTQLLSATLFCCVSFIIGQLFGWHFLTEKGVHLAGKPDGSYLYLLTGLHLVHLLVGLVILGIFTLNARKQLLETPSINFRQTVVQTSYFSDVKNYRKFRLTAIYWHFVDVLWVYLLLFFLVNHW